MSNTLITPEALIEMGFVEMEIKPISYQEAVRFLLPKHYSGRKPVISKAFGWYLKDRLMAVCSFGKPASASLCFGICGDNHSSSVYELNRLCRVDDLSYPISKFVSGCIKLLQKENWIIVSYADSGMNHNGYIYQATNFIYTGLTKERTDKYTEGNKHSRHYNNDNQNGLRKVRTAKHRYVYFATKNKRLKNQWLYALNYPVLPYPKNENKNYKLGEFQKQLIVSSKPTPPQ
jgi:hypothetical protein